MPNHLWKIEAKVHPLLPYVTVATGSELMPLVRESERLQRVRHYYRVRVRVNF